MNRKFTCIVCPNGCEIEVDYEGKEIKSIEGEGCKKGKEYVTQELVDPRRNIASSVVLHSSNTFLIIKPPLIPGFIFLDKRKYTLHTLMDCIREEYENVFEDNHMEYLIIYTNEKEEDF